MSNRTKIKYRGAFEDENDWSRDETFHAPPECDGCGYSADDTDLMDDHGILVCRYCVEAGRIDYVDNPAINSDGLIGFRLEYSLQKPLLQDNNLLYQVFQTFGLTSAVIDYGVFPFIITARLNKADAVMFRLKNLENKILNCIKDTAF